MSSDPGRSACTTMQQQTRNLDHTLGAGVKRGRRATRRLESLGITANLPPELRNPEWMADLEYVWRMRTHDALQRLDERARRLRRASKEAGRLATIAYEEADASDDDDIRAVGTQHAIRRVELSRSSEWAEHRAQAMALPRAEVVGACGKRTRTIACGCGPREVKVGCDQVQLCPTCRKKHWRRWRRKITRCMDAHVRAARGRWHSEQRGRVARHGSMMPGVYLITFTVPHSGSIAEDREALAKGWRRLSKVATAQGWWGAYALAYEVTPGKDGKGHVHIHLAAISSWIPYEELHVAWRAACPGSEILDVSAPRSTRRANAADYLAKYVTKGVEPTVFTGQKAGELLCAFRGKRKVTASRGFWTPERERERRCKACGCEHRSLGDPPALRKVAPGAVLQAMAERIGWWVPRGAVQTNLGAL